MIYFVSAVFLTPKISRIILRSTVEVFGCLLGYSKVRVFENGFRIWEKGLSKYVHDFLKLSLVINIPDISGNFINSELL